LGRRTVGGEPRRRTGPAAPWHRRPGSALDDWIRAEKEIREAEEQAIEQALDESFPASDSPAN